MPEKKICVIGASGVVGSHVVQTALRKGYKVRYIYYEYITHDLYFTINAHHGIRRNIT